MPPALGGGFVSTVRPRYATFTGSRGTAAEPARAPPGERPAARAHPVRDRGADVARIERLRAVAAEPLQRVGELRIAQHLPLPRRPALRPVQRARLGGGGEDRL